jgi:hypothetical protein
LRLPAPQLAPIVDRAHRQLKPRTSPPPVVTEYFPFAGLNHTARLRDNVLRVRISDLFIDAPESVIYSLSLILLAKLYRKKLDVDVHRVYRDFILDPQIQERARELRGTRGRAVRGRGPNGRFFDLNESFDRINRFYFGSQMERPRILWSERRSRRTLGRYDAARYSIFISRVFDSPGVPAIVVDYVMYHEMLHIRHQSCVHNCRILVHTAEFRADERRFDGFPEAKRWLKNL